MKKQQSIFFIVLVIFAVGLAACGGSDGGGTSPPNPGGTPDTTPDAFTFTDQTDVALNSIITSNAVAIGGINQTANITVTNGEYSINGGAYSTANATITNGQTVAVKHTASSSNSQTVNTTLTIGGVSDVFSSTTVAATADTTPDVFSFADQTDAAVSTVITSNAITVGGIDAAAGIVVTGGEYSIVGGDQTSNAASYSGAVYLY